MNSILITASIVWLKILRRKDLYVLLILLSALWLLLISLDAFGLGGMTGYVKDVGFMMSWLFAWVLSVTITSRELPQEESSGTIYNILSKPVTRHQILLGKALGAWSVTIAATLLFYLLIVIITRTRGGTMDLTTLFQAWLLHSALLALWVALTLAFSTRLNSDAAATLAFVFTAISFFLIPQIPELMTHEQGLKATGLMLMYHALPHAEVFDMRHRLVHDFGPVPWRLLGSILLYGVIWTAGLLYMAGRLYRNKMFTRGQQGG